jgi:predicted Zn-dependent protease with MMP-like domain
MNDEEFDNLVGEALDSLPPEFADRLENVSVTVADYPTPYQMQKMKLPPWALLFGLYEGVPQTKRGVYAGVLPDKITIFKYPILRVASTPDEIKIKVRDVVIHEIGHHFGLSDAQLR